MNSVLIIVPDGGMLFESVGVTDILMQANERNACSGQAQAPYQVTIATTQMHKAVHGRSGLTLLADARLTELDPREKRGTIMVTGRGVDAEEDDAVASWLRMAAPYTQRIVSVCGGALLLAMAGVLNGRRATTHWRLLDYMAQTWPDITVERGPIYVHDGPVWTSAGVSSGFDLTLALVEADMGHAIAREVAQDMVMYLRRPGGQSQFSRYLPARAAKPGPIRDLQDWIQSNLAENLSVEKLAESLAMSPRNFNRVFLRETGTSPAKYVEHVRLDAAREYLERTREGIEQIALQTGFGSGINLRRVFERHLQVAPTTYRERFYASTMAEIDR